MDSIVYYAGYCIIHARWFYDRICGSNTLCSASSARLLQLVSKKFFEEEIFAGTNLAKLAFDRENFPLYSIHVLCHYITPYTVQRLNDRVRKRAMTSFERDKTMSNMSSQLDYKVHPHTHPPPHTHTHIYIPLMV